MYNPFINRVANFLPLYPVLIAVSLVISILFTYGWYINFTFAKPKISEAIWGIHDKSSISSNSTESISPYVEGTNAQESQAPSSNNRGKSGNLAILLNYIFTVDLSTVTTMLLTISSICITAGFLRIYLFKKNNPVGDALSQDRAFREQCSKLSTPSFPFWSTYKHNFIYLGLLGTLFAFIIAFSQAQKEVALLNNPIVQGDMVNEATEGPADILLFALGTALWSSFSAITLSLLPVNAFFRHFFIQRIVPSDIIHGGTDDEIDEVMDRLTEKAKQTELSFAALVKTSDNLARNMDRATIQDALTQLEYLQVEFKELKKNLLSRSPLENSIKEINEALQTSMTTVNIELEKINKDLVSLSKRLDNLEKHSDEKMSDNAKNIRELREDITDMISKVKNLFN
jgi:hypothetical protein